ncbi:T6SS effector amidase Tae4 family protein [Sessilibacter corallicola]|uniref:Type VI secretion system amidase effector protein Tae4 n=1 Tax=Sessilibacter corallicola TaxID=2904075 RepID=A0ABQ0A5I1_9GAMM
MKPSFTTLKANYYSSNELLNNYVKGSDLYAEMGINHEKLIEQNPAYINTCAARVSLALLKSNISFQGRLSVKSGKFAGKKIETGAKLLADQLKRPDILGYPEIYKSNDFLANIKGRRGVVLFWKISGYGGGHIDLIDASTSTAVCSSGCYYNSKEIWFWPLK